MSLRTSCFFLATLLAASLLAQSNAPVPASLKWDLDTDRVPQAVAVGFDAAAAFADDDQRVAAGLPPADARIMELHADPDSHGEWSLLPNGDRLWRLWVGSRGAMAVEVVFVDIDLPYGASLMVHDGHGGDVHEVPDAFLLGEGGRHIAAHVLGPVCMVEYLEPAEVAGQGWFRITGVGHSYRPEGLFSAKADDCQVDVNCSEGANWQEQRDAVVRIRVRVGSSIYWCTGVVVNNTAQDCKPYVLSALHCSIGSSTSDLQDYRFVFRYQRSGCGSGAAPTGSSMTGCVKRADSNCGGGNNGSDFLLLELNNPIPASFTPYYAGWDASGQGSSSGVSIHHPSGSEKKISTYTQTLLTAQYSWGGPQSHWFVRWAGTANGHGVTEGGSSGSPIFNSAKRIIGTLTGGASYCNSVQPNGQNQPDYYGKFSWHWNNNPNTQAQKLRAWLDPGTTGVTVLDGSYNPCGPASIDELGGGELAPLLFPNPAHDRVTVEFPAAAGRVDRVEVLDVGGRLHHSQRPVHGARMDMDVSGWAPGTYMLRLIVDGSPRAASRLVVMGR